MDRYDLAAQLDPVTFATQYLHLRLDPWQTTALRAARVHLNCSRQSGKTTVAAIALAHWLLFGSGADALVVSATEAQAGETARRALGFLHALGEATSRLPGRRHDFLLKSTGARLRALPCRESAMRGYTAGFVLYDEAALIPDAVYHALTGTLASTWTAARIWMISTPRERRGFFYEHSLGDPGLGPDGFTRLRVTAAECPRISAVFRAEQQRKLPPWRYKQEYECEFGDTAYAVFTDADLIAAESDPHVPHLSRHRIEFISAQTKSRFQLGLDHGQTNDPPAVAALQHVPHFVSHDHQTLQHNWQGRLLVRYLQRLPLGIHYPDLIAWLRQLLSYPELQNNGVDLAFDATAANVFADYLRANKLDVRLVPIVITTGADASQVNGKWHVPKNELFHNLQFLFRNRSIKLAPGAGHVDELKHELASIRRIASPHGPEMFVSSAGVPDDMASALSLSAWWAMRMHKTSLLKEVA